MVQKLYNIGDYAKYEGDYSTLEERRRQPDFVKILQIKKYENYWWVGVELLGSKERISFGVNYLRPIPLEEKHLLKLGFEKLPLGEKVKFYKKGDIYISSIAINLIDANFHFLSGFCLVDSNNFENFDVKEFTENQQFNMGKFYDKYPNMYNINSIINLLEDRNLINDKEIEELLLI